jgi:LCP family protein required for cell wall assembly
MSTDKIYEQTKVKVKPKSNKTVKLRRKPRKSTNWLLIGFGLSAVAVFSATAGALLALSLSQTLLRQAALTPEEEAVFNQEETISYSSLNIPELSRPVNILVLGTKVLTSDVDEKPEQDLGYHALVNSVHGLADTMLLLRFDPLEDKFTVLSIPRDTKTYIEGHGIRKINEANYHGGPALAAETVSNLLEGVSVDRYVRINVQGIEKLIDALGGVNVYIPKDMKYTDHSQHLYINLKQGQQHLNGEQVIAFLRFRYDAYGDIGRVQRQQILMRALVEQALSPKTIIKIPEILSVIHSHIDTNLTVNELMALAAFAGQKNRSDVQMLMLPGSFNSPEEEISYWLPNQGAIETMMAQHFQVGSDFSDSDYLEPTGLRIAIQDTTDDPQAVKAMVNYLQEAGYRRVFISQETYDQPLTTTKIVAQQGDDASAAQIRANLGIGEVLVESTGVLASDITIQLGRDWIDKQIIHNNYQPEQVQTTSYINERQLTINHP